ncbi:hypothetical protein NA57DRAFT_71752 [Rhizodiscina lignyota]|uniref:Synaptobrevin n=1 Tax=Rhizodiscina lignyota TaxID=1504668 RepID=A0A9P4IMP6_9PEZI|nr:hypothetical protein NA57DRAFT_71752 [Rhizodiscina lignyota]
MDHCAQNLEYARSLLLRLEHDSSNIKIQNRKQAMQADLQSKRNEIKRLSQRLQELNDLAVNSDDDEDEEQEEDEAETQSKWTAASHTVPSQNGDHNNLDHGDKSIQSPSTTTSAALRSRHPRIASTPAATTSASLFPPNFKPPSTNVDLDPNLSQTEALLSHNRREQENLTDSLLDLVSQFKASAIQFQTSLESEKDVLAQATSGLDKNATGMEVAGRRMGTLRRMTEGKGWWARMKIYGLIVLLYVVALVIIFVLPKLRF